MKTKILLLSLLALTFALSACISTTDGGVVQGRCVAFEPEKSMTIVADTSKVRNSPNYNGAILTYKLPAEAKEVGPRPAVGGCLQIDLVKSTVTILDPATKTIKEIAVKVSAKEPVANARDPKVAGKTFPVVDKEKKTVTVYAQKMLITFRPSEDDQEYPAEVWQMGDEMRVAFFNQDKGQATRVMNVSKTDITGH
ncbi:MAG: conserved hypothetical protein [Candidatus Desulfovibrio kirbyi]|uniref:Lipoprotein n=1 Tax=Candidatus Desulfovibrio kirbyi TaxID=2696086 RepID=A0A6L2R588_9BACT|nr:MAG: conserved hypothetical protein [Candidatus Desulfovibrio kirbyi]